MVPAFPTGGAANLCALPPAEYRVVADRRICALTGEFQGDGLADAAAGAAAECESAFEFEVRVSCIQ